MTLWLLNETGERDSDRDSRVDSGLNSIYDAIDLWKVLDPPRSIELFQLLKQRLSIEDSSGRRILSKEMVLQLLPHLEDLLATAKKELVDPAGHLVPDRAETVQQTTPHLVTQWVEAGKTIRSIATPLMQIEAAIELLRSALTSGRGVELAS